MDNDKMSGPLLLVGCGNMGRAMLRGWLDSGFIRADAVHVVEPAASLREEAGALGVRAHAAVETLEPGFKAEIAIFAVKPQVMAAVLPAYRPHVAEGVTVSIAAGIPLAAIAAGLGEVAIIRAMPNTPAAIGKGSIVFCANERANEAQIASVSQLFSANGTVHRVEGEAAIDTATAISGSGPAYVFHFIECLAEAGRQLGLPSQLALALARETVDGAGTLAMATSAPPSELRRQVTSPGGTTEAALDILMGNDAFQKIVIKAAFAAHHRASELAENILIGSGGDMKALESS